MLSKIPLAAQRPLKLLFLAGLIFVAAVRLGSMTHDPAKTTAASASPSSKPVEPPVVVVPRVRPKAIVVDGRFEEADWSLRSARIAAFESTDSAEARPPSDARFLWDDEFLYIGTYAADADLRHDDSFEISMRGESAQLQFSLDPLGNFHPYPYEPRAVGPAPGLLAVKDVKGTVDDSKDGDKEWRFEIAVPWKALAISPAAGVSLQIALRRCDAAEGDGGTRRCDHARGTEPGDRLRLALAP